jgi:hypothetical protein
MSFPGHPPSSITSPRGWKSEAAAVPVVGEVAGAAAGAKPDPLGVWPLQAARAAIASAVRQRVMVALDTMRLLAGVGVFLTPIVARRPYGGVRAAASRRYRLAMTRMLKTSFSAAPMIGWSQPFTPLRAHERNAQSSGQGKLIISSWYWRECPKNAIYCYRVRGVKFVLRSTIVRFLLCPFTVVVEA